MKGLLLKDLYALYNYRKTLVWFTLAISVMGFVLGNATELIVMMFCLVLMMYVVSTFSLDEQAGWPPYCAALPVPRRQIAGAKFLFLYSMAGISILLSSILAFLAMLAGDGISASGFLTGPVLTLLLASGQCIVMPFMFKYGAEKVRILTMFAYVGPYALIFILYLTLGDWVLLLLQSPWILLVLLVYIVLATGISYFATVRVLDKLEY